MHRAVTPVCYLFPAPQMQYAFRPCQLPAHTLPSLRASSFPALISSLTSSCSLSPWPCCLSPLQGQIGPFFSCLSTALCIPHCGSYLRSSISAGLSALPDSGRLLSIATYSAPYAKYWVRVGIQRLVRVCAPGLSEHGVVGIPGSCRLRRRRGMC